MLYCKYPSSEFAGKRVFKIAPHLMESMMSFLAYGVIMLSLILSL